VQQQEATITELRSAIAQQRKDFEATIAQLRSTEAEQQKQIEALATGLQKVSDQLEVSKPAHQLVANE
jgi:uncharacterized coiled-coil protein SlyX